MATRGVNKVTILGHLGQDPDIRYMPDGSPVANLSIATSEVWKDKQTGEPHEKTEWHRVVAFRKLAEIIGQYCKKGSKVYIEGKLQTRKWQDQSGQDRYTTEIIANDLQFMSGDGQRNGPPPMGDKQPPARDDGQPAADKGQTSPSTYASAKGKPARQKPVSEDATPPDAGEEPPLPDDVPGSLVDMDDSIPF